jgi:hypothetical protein
LEELRVPWFEKPCDFKELRAAIARLATETPLA